MMNDGTYNISFGQSSDNRGCGEVRPNEAANQAQVVQARKATSLNKVLIDRTDCASASAGATADEYDHDTSDAPGNEHPSLLHVTNDDDHKSGDHQNTSGITI